jgi:ABC-type nickel/cobalt efflux system permease component RcnA
MKLKNIILLLLVLISIALPGQFNHSQERRPAKENTSRKIENIDQPSKKSFLEKNTDQQREIRRSISLKLREYKTNRSSKVLFLALGIAFLYGIIHSLGPGHGKVFLVSQVIGSKVKYANIVASSFLFAFLHSLSGLTLVAILKLLSMSLFRDSTRFSIIAQNISFAIIILLGIYILIKAILNKSSRDHSHEGKNLFLTAIMIGFVPCPGSIIIAVYAMKMGVYSTGVLMVIAMALGMAFTLIILNSLTLFIKSLASLSLKKQASIAKISRIMSFIGAILLIFLGSVFLYMNLG